MAFGVWVPLAYDDKMKLLQIARQEKRRPRQQAAVFLETALRAESPPTQPTERELAAAGR